MTELLAFIAGFFIGMGFGGLLVSWVEHNWQSGRNWRGKYEGSNEP